MPIKKPEDYLDIIIGDALTSMGCTRVKCFQEIGCYSYTVLSTKFNTYLDRLSNYLQIDRDILKEAYERDKARKAAKSRPCNKCEKLYIPVSKFDRLCPSCGRSHD